MLITYKEEAIKYESGEGLRTPPGPGGQSSHQQRWHKEEHSIAFWTLSTLRASYFAFDSFSL